MIRLCDGALAYARCTYGEQGARVTTRAYHGHGYRPAADTPCADAAIAIAIRRAVGIFINNTPHKGYRP